MASKRHRPDEIVTKRRQIDVLRGSGHADGGCGPPDRRFGADALPLAQAVWRHEGVASQAAEGARRRECAPEEASGGVDDRRVDAARDAGKTC